MSGKSGLAFRYSHPANNRSDGLHPGESGPSSGISFRFTRLPQMGGAEASLWRKYTSSSEGLSPEGGSLFLAAGCVPYRNRRIFGGSEGPRHFGEMYRDSQLCKRVAVKAQCSSVMRRYMLVKVSAESFVK